MKICFENAEKLYTGMGYLKNDLGIELVRDGADLTVSVTKSKERKIEITRHGDTAKITYGDGEARFFRALAILVYKVGLGEDNFAVKETPLFTKNGAMVDMSRDSVMRVETVKFWLRKMVLMGLNTFMLYTEDTYEIPGRPYFGHMRGRYTKEEIKEIDRYAIALGIELIPCIQVLGHLETHLKWQATAPYKDTARVLLAESDATYELIDDMLRTVKECFTSKKIHIGMDETHDLGRGAYLDKNGYKPHRDVYLAHLKKVTEMVKSYGLEPMMWSDMFFNMARLRSDGLAEYEGDAEVLSEIAKLVPKGIQQVFWDYYHPDEKFYKVNLERHDIIGENTMFAGGIWAWGGHSIHFSRSRRNTKAALLACRAHGTKEIIATVWHNGAEACQIMALAGLAWYADFDYKGDFDEQSAAECFKFATGQSYLDLLKTEAVEYPHDTDVGISRMLLYNDPLLGLFDKHIEKFDTGAYYSGVLAEISELDGGFFKEAVAVSKALADVLINKANFGVRLKRAYDKKDEAALSGLAKECDVITEKLEALRQSHRTAWLKYSKSFGWEVHDVRYGGLIARFKTVKKSIADYLDGVTAEIEELGEERLTFDGREETAPNTRPFWWNRYGDIITAGTLV